MRKLLVLVGLQGSGKTTALESVTNATVLRPSTSRTARAGETNEYHFETSWDESLMAWTINRGSSQYGMRRAELDQVREAAITVFDPGNIKKLEDVKASLNFEVITVGLDTIESLTEQSARVEADPSRVVPDQRTFDRERAVVLNCDVVLSGDASQIEEGLDAVIRTVCGRGGLLEEDSIRKLISAGTLLKNAALNGTETASYDLSVADTYWCQGRYLDANDTNGAVLIPPYSFVLVQSVEEACLPRFVAGNFDLAVSLFLDGVILSNGPQVDPGYRGALFCMLYNTSDNFVPISPGKRFATIQFTTTASVAHGYIGQYQNKKTFRDFVTARAANSPGGKILERMNDLDLRMKDLFKELKTEVTTTSKEGRDELHKFAALWATLMTGGLIAMAVYSYNMADKASTAADKANAAIEASGKQADKFNEMMKDFNEKANSVTSKKTAPTSKH
jgi:deoxycytidine triphosphate deaminase/predicted kinase